MVKRVACALSLYVCESKLTRYFGGAYCTRNANDSGYCGCVFRFDRCWDSVTPLFRSCCCMELRTWLMVSALWKVVITIALIQIVLITNANNVYCSFVEIRVLIHKAAQATAKNHFCFVLKRIYGFLSATYHERGWLRERLAGSVWQLLGLDWQVICYGDLSYLSCTTMDRELVNNFRIMNYCWRSVL